MTWEVWTVCTKPQRVRKRIISYTRAEKIASWYREAVGWFRWVSKVQYTVRRAKRPC